MSRKGGTGGGGLVYTPKGMAVCGFGCKNPSVGSLHKCMRMVLENSHLTSRGLWIHVVFKCYLLARAG